jgi:hypothetical protein
VNNNLIVATNKQKNKKTKTKKQFPGNPLEQKHSEEGNWVAQVQQRLPNLKKMDGEFASDSTPHPHPSQLAAENVS